MQARTPQVPFNRALAVLDSGYVGSMGYDLQILDTCNRHHACMRLLDKILQYIMYDEIKCWISQHSEPQQEIFIARTTATEGVRFTVYPVQQVLEHHRSYCCSTLQTWIKASKTYADTLIKHIKNPVNSCKSNQRCRTP